MPTSPYCRCGRPFETPDAFLVCAECWAKIPKATQDLLIQYHQTEPGSARCRDAIADAMKALDAA